MKALYEAQVTSTGGRNGHVKSSDGILDLNVTMPKELGGAGGATNPEQLFAAGYAACFENALLHVARQKKIAVKDTRVTAHVGLLAREEGGFKLTAQLDVSLPGLEKGAALALIEAGHQVCPYSNATRGNVDVKLNLVD
jgi:Ohr subfamily peroxiredoxin